MMSLQPVHKGAQLRKDRVMSQQPKDQDGPDNRPPESRPSESPLRGGDGEARQVTRAGMVWVSVASALVVLVLLIAFILQNQDDVQVRYFGLQGTVPLGVALFIAAVGGGILVAIAGAVRIIQLRTADHRRRVQSSTPPSKKARKRG